jgi:hypothetical protein
MVLIFSAILAGIIVGLLLPPPNIAGAGAVTMCVMIFLTVAFKAIIEFLLSKRRKRIANRRDNQRRD